MSRASGIEFLLRRALAPVDPPEAVSTRVRSRLQTISDLAAEELEDWELAAMRRPRDWVRPALAIVGGSAAGAALLVLRAHQRRRGVVVRVTSTASAFVATVRRVIRSR